MYISNMIDAIQRMPSLFLDSNKITALWHFLNGYQAAERANDICQIEDLFPLPFQYMHEYTAYRLQDLSTAGWCYQILNSCNGVEDIALQRFFEFYDELKQIRMKRYWKAVLSEDNIAWNDQMKGAYRCSGPHASRFGPYSLADLPDKAPISHNPLTVYVMELTIPACIFAVETAADIRPETSFFASLKKAQRSTVSCFGPIDSWLEFTAPDISFGKKIVI